MIVTKDEAMAKWCPFARVAVGEAADEGQPIQLVAANRAVDFANPRHARCIASDCMAWRWDEKAYFNNRGAPLRETDEPYIDHTRTKGVKGHCGLAGKP